MREEGFRAWLATQGQALSSVSTRLSDARRVQAHYADLDDLYKRDRLEGLLAELRYTAADRLACKPNPTPLVIHGDLYDSLASYRSAVATYYRFLADAHEGVAAGWAETELRRRYGAPIADTEKMIGFALPDARQIALQRDVRGTQIWLEGDPARGMLSTQQVRQYLAEQPRHSNLPPRLRHQPPGGGTARRVSLVTIADEAMLRAVLDWYDGGKGGASQSRGHARDRLEPEAAGSDGARAVS